MILQVSDIVCMYMYEVFCRAAAPMTRAEGFGNNKIEAEIEIFLKKLKFLVRKISASLVCRATAPQARALSARISILAES